MLGVKNCLAGFQSLFSGTGKLFRDAGNQLNRGDSGSGYTAFCFDLSPDHCSGDHFTATFGSSFILRWPNIVFACAFADAIFNTCTRISQTCRQ